MSQSFALNGRGYYFSLAGTNKLPRLQDIIPLKGELKALSFNIRWEEARNRKPGAELCPGLQLFSKALDVVQSLEIE